MALEALETNNMETNNIDIDTAQKLATHHWDFIDKLLLTSDLLYQQRNLKKLLYISAFEHGFKHGLEYASAKNSGTEGGTEVITHWVYEQQ